MSPQAVIKTLSILCVVLVAAFFFAVDRALYYRSNPYVRVERHTDVDVVYGNFNPDRSQAYRCVPQKAVDSVGMVCKSPQDEVTVNCTIGHDTRTEYFC